MSLCVGPEGEGAGAQRLGASLLLTLPSWSSGGAPSSALSQAYPSGLEMALCCITAPWGFLRFHFSDLWTLPFDYSACFAPGGRAGRAGFKPLFCSSWVEWGLLLQVELKLLHGFQGPGRS